MQRYYIPAILTKHFTEFCPLFPVYILTALICCQVWSVIKTSTEETKAHFYQTDIFPNLPKSTTYFLRKKQTSLCWLQGLALAFYPTRFNHLFQKLNFNEF